MQASGLHLDCKLYQAVIMWLFRNTPPLVIAAVLSAVMVALSVAGVLALIAGLIVTLFFNGFGWRP
jgi:hypothetical protein